MQGVIMSVSFLLCMAAVGTFIGAVSFFASGQILDGLVALSVAALLRKAVLYCVEKSNSAV